jgi:hypothetical protein
VTAIVPESEIAIPVFPLSATTPVFDIVTALVALETSIPFPATFDVTPMFVITISSVESETPIAIPALISLNFHVVVVLLFEKQMCMSLLNLFETWDLM